MDKITEEYVAKKCEEALLSNNEYMAMEGTGVDTVELLEKAETICFRKGMSEAYKNIFNLLSI